MTELEKLEAGLPYDFTDAEVDARKLNALKLCQKLNATSVTDYAAREKIVRELFGSAGENPVVLPVFNCDNGKNIRVGNNFLANYNVTILPGVTIGNNVVIAAGAVVTKDVADNSLVGGVPAKLIKNIPNDVEE